jgi:hypothetical protein
MAKIRDVAEEFARSLSVTTPTFCASAEFPGNSVK